MQSNSEKKKAGSEASGSGWYNIFASQYCRHPSRIQTANLSPLTTVAQHCLLSMTIQGLVMQKNQPAGLTRHDLGVAMVLGWSSFYGARSHEGASFLRNASTVLRLGASPGRRWPRSPPGRGSGVWLDRDRGRACMQGADDRINGLHRHTCIASSCPVEGRKPQGRWWPSLLTAGMTSETSGCALWCLASHQRSPAAHAGRRDGRRQDREQGPRAAGISAYLRSKQHHPSPIGHANRCGKTPKEDLPIRNSYLVLPSALARPAPSCTVVGSTCFFDICFFLDRTVASASFPSSALLALTLVPRSANDDHDHQTTTT